MAGYSSTPHIQKLGLKPHTNVVFYYEPPTFRNILGPGLTDIHVAQSYTKGKNYDAIHLFVRSRNELVREVQSAMGHVKTTGMLWISWPKQSAKIPTDLTEQVLRDVLLPLGMVDVKVCAIDEIWSALKFVRRRNLDTITESV